MAGGRNWLEGELGIPGRYLRPEPAPREREEGGPDELAATPVPCPALIRRQHQRELKVNDDICLTEEMEREGPVGRGGPGGQTAPLGST